ncbi:ATP-binding protein [Paenibacillus sp. CAU 1782]
MENVMHPMELWLLPILILLAYVPQGFAFWLFFNHFLLPRRSLGALIAVLSLFYLAKAVLAAYLTPLYSVGVHLAAYMVISVFFFCGGKLQKIFFVLYYTAATIAIEMLALYAGSGLIRLGILGRGRMDAGLWVVPFLLVLGGIIAVIGVLRLFKINSPFSLPGKEWGILSLVPGGSLLVILAGLPGQADLNNLLQMKLPGGFIAGCAAVLVINVAVMLLYQRLMARLQLEQNNLLLQRQIREYVRKQDENRKTAHLRHDLNHIMSGLEAWLKGKQWSGDARKAGNAEDAENVGTTGNIRNTRTTGTTGEAGITGINGITGTAGTAGSSTAAASYLLDLISRYKSDGEGKLGLISTGQPVIDSICNEKIEEAARHGIKVGVHAAIPSDLQLTHKEIELALILGNALDNAIEAVLRLGEDERGGGAEPPIVLELVYQEGLLLIALRNAANSVIHDKRGSYLSSKRAGEQSGFGLDSIRYGVERLQGNVTFRYEDGSFKMTVVLPIAP